MTGIRGRRRGGPQAVAQLAVPAGEGDELVARQQRHAVGLGGVAGALERPREVQRVVGVQQPDRPRVLRAKAGLAFDDPAPGDDRPPDRVARRQVGLVLQLVVRRDPAVAGGERRLVTAQLPALGDVRLVGGPRHRLDARRDQRPRRRRHEAARDEDARVQPAAARAPAAKADERLVGGLDVHGRSGGACGGGATGAGAGGGVLAGAGRCVIRMGLPMSPMRRGGMLRE